MKTPPVDFRFVCAIRGPLVVFSVFRFRLGETPLWITWSGVLN